MAKIISMQEYKNKKEARRRTPLCTSSSPCFLPSETCVKCPYAKDNQKNTLTFSPSNSGPGSKFHQFVENLIKSRMDTPSYGDTKPLWCHKPSFCMGWTASDLTHDDCTGCQFCKQGPYKK